jgi:hypothetical protein
MIEGSPETDIEFDAPRLTSLHKHRSAECYCSRATLDDLLSDEVMVPVLRSAGYEPDEFREMMKEMAWKPGHALIGGKRSRECRLRGGETGWSASSLAIEKALREA